jgi:hypothetical protein
MGQAADFFISYTAADRASAEWIAWQLETEGYQVVVQAWDFGPGRDWVHEMQQATATAERVVAVLSAAYFESGHGEAEWRVFYADDPSGAQGRLLPVRVGPVEPPGLLKTRVYVDLVDQDSTSARQALLAAARGARGASQSRSRSFPLADYRPPARLSRLDSPETFRRSGMCRITPTPTSPAVTCCSPRFMLG